MPSPFRYNKQERRRLRKRGRQSQAIQGHLEGKGPELAAWAGKMAPLTRTIAASNLRMAQARRRRKSKGSH